MLRRGGPRPVRVTTVPEAFRVTLPLLHPLFHAHSRSYVRKHTHRHGTPSRPLADRHGSGAGPLSIRPTSGGLEASEFPALGPGASDRRSRYVHSETGHWSGERFRSRPAKPPIQGPPESCGRSPRDTCAIASLLSGVRLVRPVSSSDSRSERSRPRRSRCAPEGEKYSSYLLY